MCRILHGGKRCGFEELKNSSTLLLAWECWERKRNRTPSASPAFRQAGMALTIQFPSTSEHFDNRITCYCFYAYCLLSYCCFDFDKEIIFGLEYGLPNVI